MRRQHLPKGDHPEGTSAALMERKTTPRNPSRHRTGCISFTELFWTFAGEKKANPAERSDLFCVRFNSFFLTSLLFQVPLSWTCSKLERGFGLFMRANKEAL